MKEPCGKTCIKTVFIMIWTVYPSLTRNIIHFVKRKKQVFNIWMLRVFNVIIRSVKYGRNITGKYGLTFAKTLYIVPDSLKNDMKTIDVLQQPCWEVFNTLNRRMLKTWMFSPDCFESAVLLPFVICATQIKKTKCIANNKYTACIKIVPWNSEIVLTNSYEWVIMYKLTVTESIVYGGIAQLARAFGSYPECRRFESHCRYWQTAVIKAAYMARWSSG